MWKKFEKLDLHTNKHGRRKDFFRGGQQWIFPGQQC